VAVGLEAANLVDQKVLKKSTKAESVKKCVTAYEVQINLSSAETLREFLRRKWTGLSLVPIPQTPEKGGVERRPAWAEASA
jgi:hypothetical protein